MRSTLVTTAAAGLAALALLASSGAASARQQVLVPAADHSGITVGDSLKPADLKAECHHDTRTCQLRALVLRPVRGFTGTVSFKAEFIKRAVSQAVGPEPIHAMGYDLASSGPHDGFLKAIPANSVDAGWAARWPVSVEFDGERLAADQPLRVTGLQCDRNIKVCAASLDVGDGRDWVAEWTVTIEPI